MMEYALKVEGLRKEYPGFVLDGIDIALPVGCVMGFIGENGAGKSTTIKLILDLIRKDAGKISVLGEILDTEHGQLKEKIVVVMDECNFPESMTVTNIERMMRGCYRTWDRNRFEQYRQKFQLPSDKKIKDFSRGMKMKLSIAVALSHDSRLLILDEATSGLDPIVRDEILDIFLEFIQNEDHSIFISSHILSDLEKICDYITFIHRGKLVFSEEKESLREKYVVVKCSEKELNLLVPSAVIGVRKNSFGVEALVERKAVPEHMVQDPASIEDIMLYYVKSE